jgi:3',5'-cyclic AMP phosphodiesterase CpdA
MCLSEEDVPVRVIITADLHFTDRPQDKYRWELFRWLSTQQYDILVVLGDLTDAKDCHSARLVNKIVNELLTVVNSGHEVHVLMGNHDYQVEGSPFFDFLRYYPGCYYHRTVVIWELGNTRWAFYPHTRDPASYWSSMRHGKEVGVDFTCCHQVFDGARSEHGRALRGVRPGSLTGSGKIFAGDVHVPQIVGQVEYVGAPYPIRFGDDFEPGVVLVEGHNQWSRIGVPTIKKLVIEVSNPGDVDYDGRWRHGDHVKVRLVLNRSDFSRWSELRQQVHNVCKRNELVLCGIELLERKRKRRHLDDRDGSGPTAEVVSMSHIDQFDLYCNWADVLEADVAVGRGLMCCDK